MTAPTIAPQDRAAFDQLVRPDRPAGSQSLRLEVPSAGVSLAAGDPDLIVGMPVLKCGVFNGVFEVTRDDLDAFVARFDELVGVFRPPMRLDHSWGVMDVIGRFEALRVENRPDDTIGGTVVPFLVADWRLVGTKAQKAELRERMTGDHPHLLERSSEFWPYRTNAGAEYPLVFAGCAFVDVPAVEGLGAFMLRRSTADGEAGAILTVDSTDHPGGDPVTDNPTPTPADSQDPTAGEGGTPAPQAPAAPAPAADPEPQVEAAPVVTDEDPEPEPEPTPADLAAALGAGVTLSAESRARVEAYIDERVRLRRESEERYARHLARGVIPKGVQDSVRALLSHTDAAVRDGVAAFLDVVQPAVKLGAKDGTLGLSSSGAPAGDRTTEVIHLDMTREEAIEAYNALDAAGRQKYRRELAAWQAAHPSGADE